ncbi:MAG TPA: hypothetical protein VF516_10845 [Kofleriaceae bacterium]
MNWLISLAVRPNAGASASTIELTALWIPVKSPDHDALAQARALVDLAHRVEADQDLDRARRLEDPGLLQRGLDAADPCQARLAR